MSAAIAFSFSCFIWLLLGITKISQRAYLVACLNFCAAGFFALAAWAYFLAASK